MSPDNAAERPARRELRCYHALGAEAAEEPQLVVRGARVPKDERPDVES